MITFKTKHGGLVHAVAKSDRPYLYHPLSTRLLSYCGVSCSSKTAIYAGKNKVEEITCPRCRAAIEKRGH